MPSMPGSGTAVPPEVDEVEPPDVVEVDDEVGGPPDVVPPVVEVVVVPPVVDDVVDPPEVDDVVVPPVVVPPVVLELELELPQLPLPDLCPQLQ